MIGILLKNPLTAPIAPLSAGAMIPADLPNIFAASPPTFVAASLLPIAPTPFPSKPFAALRPLPIAVVMPFPRNFKLNRLNALAIPLLKILPKNLPRFLSPVLRNLNFNNAMMPIKAALRNVPKFVMKVSNFFRPSSPKLSNTNPRRPSYRPYAQSTNVINPFIRNPPIFLTHSVTAFTPSIKPWKSVLLTISINFKTAAPRTMLVMKLDKKSPTFCLCFLNGSLSPFSCFFSNCSSLFAFLSSDASLFASSIFFFSAATDPSNSFSTVITFFLTLGRNLDAIAILCCYPQSFDFMNRAESNSTKIRNVSSATRSRRCLCC